MKTFVEEIAELLLRKEPEDLASTTVIFPNRRAGLFLQQELGTHISKPIWMPRIVSLEDFILSQSDLEKIETLEAIFELYQVYKQYQQQNETFDKFYFWGEMILRDFEEIDHYQVNAEHLFTSIKSQKELDEEFYFLSEEEKSIIESFWSTFLPQSTKSQQAFLETWKLLRPIYEEFRQQLITSGKAYTGLIYSEYLQALESGDASGSNGVLFAGFNALTKAEEKIIRHYLKECDAEMIWDTDGYYLKNELQEAGFFHRLYAKDPFLGKGLQDVPERIVRDKQFLVTGVSLEVGQAKAMAEHLEDLTQRAGFVPERTVIILPHEYMLFPVLHSLPDSISNVNITMGFSLKDTPVFSLVESLLQLQKGRRISLVQAISFYHKPTLEILTHPMLRPLGLESKLREFVKQVRRRNLIYVPQSEIPLEHPLLELIYSEVEDPLEYLLTVIQQLHVHWKDDGGELEQEFFARFYQHLNALKLTIGASAENLGFEFLIKLIRRLSKSLKIPFDGEPLKGLQIMGVLETRNLDFENVFVLNMNENSWPAPPRAGSFVPYNIRRAFDLPTHEHNDAIYAYLFYRLLQRSDKVWFYYNTVSEFNVNGELSRLVKQLKMESNHQISTQILANPITIPAQQPITMKMDDRVLDRLSRFTTDSKEKYMSRLTPSALDVYLQCRLRFYFKYVEGLYEEDELREELDPMVFGNILHDAMEILYDQFMKSQKRDIVEPNDILFLSGGIDGAVNQAFVKHYAVGKKEKFKLEGRNIIAAEVIKQTVEKVLEIDQRYMPFQIVGLESSTREGYSVDYPIKQNGRKYVVGLRGKIDRIDYRQGVLRIIDYKTGKDEKQFGEISSLIDREDPKRNKAAFQVMFYSYMAINGYDGAYDRIEPGLFNSKNLFEKDFDWRLIQKVGKGPATPVTSFEQHVDEFEEVLSNLLEEIWDRNVAFDQTTDEKKCGFCAYKGICGR